MNATRMITSVSAPMRKAGRAVPRGQPRNPGIRGEAISIVAELEFASKHCRAAKLWTLSFGPLHRPCRCDCFICSSQWPRSSTPRSSPRRCVSLIATSVASTLQGINCIPLGPAALFNPKTNILPRLRWCAPSWLTLVLSLGTWPE